VTHDDDIVVPRVGKGHEVDSHAVPEALSERLGIEATAELVDLFGRAEKDMTDTIVMRAIERFDRRLAEEISKLRIEMLQGDAALRTDIQAVRSDLRDQKAELLKWSFLFWVGQVAAVAALFQLTGR
jgi:SpoVK/Ycf46/Vps4 family AAA+-type ATPase